MKSSFFISILLAFYGLSTIAQEQKIALDESKKLGNATKTEVFTVESCGEVNTPSADLKWKPVLTHKKTKAFRPKVPDFELMEELKAEKMMLKQQDMSGGSEGSSRTATPIVGTNFAGNFNNGYTPMDNSIAISDGGIIVSVVNSSIEIDNSSGTNLYYNDIATFFNDPQISVACDPVVLYDRIADRFIFFFQECSGNSANSYLCISFSKTNNPATGGWWKYKITGDPLNDFSWFDYPKMAISDNELYITGNLFTDWYSFNQSVLYQIQKTAGYSGGNLNWQLWHNIPGPPFSLLPVGSGQGLSYGPGCYLVSSDHIMGSTINLYDLTDDMTASNEQLNFYSVPTVAYSLPADAEQLGTSTFLLTGDSRIQNGFFLNGTIHFVFTSDIGNGWGGINYNRLNLSNTTNQSKILGAPGNFDYAYPSVVSYATTSSDKSVMIGFGRAGATIYPEIRVVNCDNVMNWSSSTLVKSSNSYANSIGGGYDRWGDYSGTSRKHNNSTPSIWMSGGYANFSHIWNTWIAEVHHAGTVAPVAAFSASNTNICTGHCLNFFDNSTNNPTGWAWSFPGGTPSSSTSQNPTNICYNTPGTYPVTLTATNSGGTNTKTTSSYINVSACSGITEREENSSMLVYPNPVAEAFKVEFNLAERVNLEISIFDIAGKLVKELYLGQGHAGKNIFSFNKTNLLPGTYFLIIQDDSNIIMNEKIIIAH